MIGIIQIKDLNTSRMSLFKAIKGRPENMIKSTSLKEYFMAELTYQGRDGGSRVENIQQITYAPKNTIHFNLNLAVGNKIAKSIVAKATKDMERQEGKSTETSGISPYDWYVHTSLLKDINKTYAHFSQLMEKKIQKQEVSQYQYPIVELFTRTNTLLRAPSEQLYDQMVYIPSDQQINMSTSVTMDNNPYTGDTREKEIIRHVGVNVGNILKEVQRDIEDKLGYERLRKGI